MVGGLVVWSFGGANALEMAVYLYVCVPPWGVLAGADTMLLGHCWD